MTEHAVRDLYDAIIKELAAKNLVLEPGWRLKFDHSKRRFGCCRYGSRTISMSRSLCALNDAEKVGATIRHEIAHALVGPDHGHDHVWKMMARRCGDTGDRCYGADVATPPAPWAATCPKCKKTYKRHRAAKPGRKVWCKCLGYSGVNGNEPPPELCLSFTMTAPAVMTPTSVTQVASGTGVENIAKVLELRATGMGYVAIDAAFGIHGKKGWWSWRIVKNYGR